MTHGNGHGSFLGAFLLGAAAGATVALLTTPRSGREMRRQLKSAALDMKKKMKRAPAAIEAAGSKAMQLGEEVYEQVRDEVTHAPGLS